MLFGCQSLGTQTGIPVSQTAGIRPCPFHGSEDVIAIGIKNQKDRRLVRREEGWGFSQGTKCLMLLPKFT